MVINRLITLSIVLRHNLLINIASSLDPDQARYKLLYTLMVFLKAIFDKNNVTLQRLDESKKGGKDQSSKIY